RRGRGGRGRCRRPGAPPRLAAADHRQDALKHQTRRSGFARRRRAPLPRRVTHRFTSRARALRRAGCWGRSCEGPSHCCVGTARWEERPMPSVRAVLTHATQTLPAAVEVVSDVVQNLESQTKEVIQAVVDVAVAVSEALVAGTWNEFFAKLQEAFEAMNRVRALRANMGNLDELMLNLSKKQDKERVEEI